MKIVALSDTHGQLPQPQTIPDSDILLMPGDICNHTKAPGQLHWLDSKFRNWLNKINRPVFACAGNHDWVFYEQADAVKRLDLPNFYYLQDSRFIYKGISIYGTPWQREFFNWAFNLKEHELVEKWNMIPDDTDILVCHSPPKFYGDKTPDGDFIGSETLTWRIGQIKPTLVVFGHCHNGYGVYQSGGTILANVSVLNEAYKLVNPPFFTEIF